jgi:hypothetical protein
MQSGYRADVEAAELGPVLARRHVHTGNFGQVLLSGGVGHLSPQLPDGRDLQRSQRQ